MALTDSVNVRLPPDMKSRLEALANEFGVKSAVLARIALEEGIRNFEKQDTLTIKKKVAVTSTTTSAHLNEAAHPSTKKRT